MSASQSLKSEVNPQSQFLKLDYRPEKKRVILLAPEEMNLDHEAAKRFYRRLRDQGDFDVLDYSDAQLSVGLGVALESFFRKREQHPAAVAEERLLVIKPNHAKHSMQSLPEARLCQTLTQCLEANGINVEELSE